MSGRHTGGDRVQIAMGAVCAAAGAALLSLLAIVAREPCPCSVDASPRPVPVSAPDIPPPGTP
ncbi:hypothetical protein [Streptacidiphilus albus]|uniref:hypothetical protein n=1 Tax=Streptacidiphilus albus TaxID=105425 RepID=UPI00054C106B|nr:hypothetical protein [Streptacidiphilus albus]